MDSERGMPRQGPSLAAATMVPLVVTVLALICWRPPSLIVCNGPQLTATGFDIQNVQLFGTGPRAGKLASTRISGEAGDVCIVIPTYGRSQELRSAIESVFLQTIMDAGIRLLVVDNNAQPVERPLVATLSTRFDHAIEYMHEPVAGVSNARNAAMKAAAGSRYLAFLDDDMCASPEWLDALLAVSKRFAAGIVFGPTYAIMPDQNNPANRYMRPFFECVVDKDVDGYIEESLGIGGCLMDLEYCQLPDPPFDAELNNRGGEDDILLDRLQLSGTRLAYATAAITFEIVPEHRATPAYIWKRNFGYGQGPSRIHASRGLKGVFGVVYYMMTGSVQMAVYGASYGLRKLVNHPSSMKYLALTARAVGKIFWLSFFSPRLYGGDLTNTADG